MKYEVYEDNSGRLTLFALNRNNRPVYAHDMYELHQSMTDILDDMKELQEGGNPIKDKWEGGLSKKDLENAYGWASTIVADNQGFYVAHMGSNAQFMLLSWLDKELQEMLDYNLWEEDTPYTREEIIEIATKELLEQKSEM